MRSWFTLTEFVDSGLQAKVEKLKYLRILFTSEGRTGVEDWRHLNTAALQVCCDAPRAEPASKAGD